MLCVCTHIAREASVLACKNFETRQTHTDGERGRKIQIITHAYHGVLTVYFPAYTKLRATTHLQVK